MKRKELTKTFMMISNWKKPFGLYGSHTIYDFLKERVVATLLEKSACKIGWELPEKSAKWITTVNVNLTISNLNAHWSHLGSRLKLLQNMKLIHQWQNGSLQRWDSIKPTLVVGWLKFKCLLPTINIYLLVLPWLKTRGTGTGLESWPNCYNKLVKKPWIICIWYAVRVSFCRNIATVCGKRREALYSCHVCF